VLDDCIGKEKGGEEYLRVERSFLNSIDKEKARKELVTVVLGKCHKK
jgi:hypothetical protein